MFEHVFWKDEKGTSPTDYGCVNLSRPKIEPNQTQIETKAHSTFLQNHDAICKYKVHINTISNGKLW